MGTEYLFGDSIDALTETPDGVDVRFERAAPRRFDLVVGADGIVGAHVLAGELAASRDHVTAFARYEALLRPYATPCQAGAADVGPVFASKTRARLWARNALFGVLTSPRLGAWLNRFTSRGATNLALPDYA